MDTDKLIKTALFTPGPRGWGLPLMFWGPPGAAKSDIIEAAARKYGFIVEILSPGERGDGGFGVTPVPVMRGDGKYVMEYPPPDWAVRFAEFERGLLFVDEINTAAPHIQPALLGLVQARRIGSTRLNRGVRVMGAANPLTSAANGFEISSAQANRLIHLDYQVPKVRVFQEFLLTHDGLNGPEDVQLASEKTTAAEEARVLDAWPTAFARAKGLLSGFIQARPDKLHAEPAPDNPEQSRAWPSLRTWEMTARAMASAQIHSMADVDTVELIAATVGAGAAAEFWHYAQNADLPPVEKLLNSEVSWTPNFDRVDTVMAVVSSCVSFVLQNRDQAKRSTMKGFNPTHLDKLYSILHDLSKDAARDLAIIGARSLMKAGAPTGKAGGKLLAEIAKDVQIAGLLENT